MLKAAGVDLVMTVHNHKPEVVKEMTALRDKALAQLTDDPAGRQRFLYWTCTFAAFVKEARALQGKKVE